jgi:hypothetical protein
MVLDSEKKGGPEASGVTEHPFKNSRSRWQNISSDAGRRKVVPEEGNSLRMEFFFSFSLVPYEPQHLSLKMMRI